MELAFRLAKELLDHFLLEEVQLEFGIGIARLDQVVLLFELRLLLFKQRLVLHE